MQAQATTDLAAHALPSCHSGHHPTAMRLLFPHSNPQVYASLCADLQRAGAISAVAARARKHVARRRKVRQRQAVLGNAQDQAAPVLGRAVAAGVQQAEGALQGRKGCRQSGGADATVQDGLIKQCWAGTRIVPHSKLAVSPSLPDNPSPPNTR